MGWISDIADYVTDRILMGLVGAACGTLGLAADAIMAVDKIIITIKGIITHEKLKEKMKEHGVDKNLIDRVDTCENIVSFRDLETESQYEVKGDGISSEIKVGSSI